MFKKRVIKDSRVSKRKIGDINEASEDAPDTQVTKKYPHHQEVRHTEKSVVMPRSSPQTPLSKSSSDDAAAVEVVSQKSKRAN